MSKRADSTPPESAAPGSGKRRSAAALGRQTADYFARCDEGQRKPTWQGLAGHLGVSSETLTDWLRGALGEAVSQTLQRAADTLSDRLQQRTDSMAMLSIKQPIFGGFADRARESGGGQISIEVTVGGGGAAETADYGG